MGLLDWTYICNILWALIAVKANGRITEYLSSSFGNVTAPSSALGAVALAVVISLGMIVAGAVLFWRRLELPVLALVLATVFLVGGELLGLLYFLVTLVFAAGWFLFWRKDFLI